MADPLTVALGFVGYVLFWVVALAITWLTHEVYLHGGIEVLRQLVRRQTPWPHHLLGHGSAFIPSYILLFLGYSSILGFAVTLLEFR